MITRHRFTTDKEGTSTFLAPPVCEYHVVATIPRSRLQQCDACENWHLVLIEDFDTTSLQPFVAALLSLDDAWEYSPGDQCNWPKGKHPYVSRGNGIVEYEVNRDEGLLTANIPPDCLDWCDDCEAFHLSVFQNDEGDRVGFRWIATLLALAVSCALAGFARRPKEPGQHE